MEALCQWAIVLILVVQGLTLQPSVVLDWFWPMCYIQPCSRPPALLPLLTEGHTEDMDYLCSDSHQVVNICMVLTFWLL